MPRVGKFFLIFLPGYMVMLIVIGETENWWTHILSTGLFTMVCAIVAASADEDVRGRAGWAMFVAGLAFTGIFALVYTGSGPEYAGCKLAAWLCGFEAVIFGLMVGVIPVAEKSVRGKP